MTYFRSTPLDRAKAAVAKFRASKRLSRKLAAARPIRHVVAHRAPGLILENLPELLQGWLLSVSKDIQLRKLSLVAKERIDNFPEIVAGICGQVMNGSDVLDKATAAYAAEHGISRFKHGYSADMIVTESRLLQREIRYFLQQNLLAIDLSTLISDVMSIADLISISTEESIRSFNAQSQAA